MLAAIQSGAAAIPAELARAAVATVWGAACGAGVAAGAR
jgi:hypothetical protein